MKVVLIRDPNTTCSRVFLSVICPTAKKADAARNPGPQEVDGRVVELKRVSS